MKNVLNSQRAVKFMVYSKVILSAVIAFLLVSTVIRYVPAANPAPCPKFTQSSRNRPSVAETSYTRGVITSVHEPLFVKNLNMKLSFSRKVVSNMPFPLFTQHT